MIRLSGSRWMASAAINSGLLPASMPKCQGFAGVEDLLDDLAKLVDLDRKHAAIHVAVPHRFDRLGKRLVDRFHAIAQQIMKTHGKGKVQFALLGLRHDLHQVDLLIVRPVGENDNVSLLVHGEISPAPPVHVVEGNSVFSAEVRHGRAEISAGAQKIQPTFSSMAKKSQLCLHCLG